LRAEAVSFWSGSLTDDASDKQGWSRLVEECRALCRYAEPRGVRLGFEPEPGMLVETTDGFTRLREAVDHPRLGLTLDVGHVHCLGDGEPADHVRAQRDWLVNVHIEDMRHGTHDHLRFGEGEMDFKAILRALREIDYAGPVNVELSRHSHDAVRVATESFEFLTSLGKSLT
jgi:sugar phosphate isomerase/epimerase